MKKSDIRKKCIEDSEFRVLDDGLQLRNKTKEKFI
jgi:hypothetical protein